MNELIISTEIPIFRILQSPFCLLDSDEEVIAAWFENLCSSS